MSTTPSKSRAVPVPSGRLTRLTRLGGLATRVAGAAMAEGAREWSRGQRPEWRDLVLSPANIHRLTDELARMRGAAMKMGQLMSMDTGDLLPAELTAILARLRADADFMPPRQLRDVLDMAWGSGWRRSFDRFDVRPIAAASIGQVHRARLRDGRDVAVKVQYPGVSASIDSDVTNVGALLRAAQVLPKGFDLAPYLEEAKRQLHDETDYLREGQHMAAFGARLSDQPQFHVPQFIPEWSSKSVLTMSFAHGHPLEQADTLPQSARDAIATQLLHLMLREVFEFGDVQSDPNFANFLYDPDSARIVLLDFGATRRLDPALVDLLRDFLVAGAARNDADMQGVLTRLGLIDDTVPPAQAQLFADMVWTVFDALTAGQLDDFADTTVTQRMQAMGTDLARSGYVPPAVPMDVLFVQRKLAGLALLAARLRARVPVAGMLDAELARTQPDLAP